MPARRRIKFTKDTAPPNYEPYADRQIPDKVWCHWTDDGKPRMLTRQLTQTERVVIERRAIQLEAAILPFHESETDDVAIALADLFGSYTSSRQKGDDVLAKVASCIQVLAEFPAWAIEATCMNIRKTGYRVDGRLEQTFAPSDAQLFGAVEEFLSLRKKHAQAARALLEASVQPQAPAPVTPVEASLEDFHKRMGKSEEETIGEKQERERRRKAMLKGNLEDRRREYINAGLKPPAGENFTSLAMLLSLGWRVEQHPQGGNVLVQP